MTGLPDSLGSVAPHAVSELVSVRGLTVALPSSVPIIADVSFGIPKGKALGLVGESGSGKSTLAVALLGYARHGARIVGGTVEIAGHSMLAGVGADEHRLVSYVPQDPASSLNPARRIGKQLFDRVSRRSEDERTELVRTALRRAQLPSDNAFLRRFPHQLSGGQQQRVLIALAIVGEPAVVVLDEPTTGLDVITQAALLREIASLRQELGISLLYVSHDIAAVSAVADDLAIMYAGRIVELGPARDVLDDPGHPYTQGLLESVPDHLERVELCGIPGVAVAPGDWPKGCAFAPRCPIRAPQCEAALPELVAKAVDHTARCVRLAESRPNARAIKPASSFTRSDSPLLRVESLRATHRGRGELVVAAEDVSFEVHRGECLAVVGESGSGKTTVARCLIGLHTPDAGTIRFDDQILGPRARARPRDVRRRIQFVFQNPYESLNPRTTVELQLARAAASLRRTSRTESRGLAVDALSSVRLPKRVLTRYPPELSGGERQRVALARALVASPDLIVCDEITSALDVSVQAAVLELLDDLRHRLSLSLVFITHDLGVVASIADAVLVLRNGHVCDRGYGTAFFVDSTDSYTRELVEAVPRLGVRS